MCIHLRGQKGNLGILYQSIVLHLISLRKGLLLWFFASLMASQPQSSSRFPPFPKAGVTGVGHSQILRMGARIYIKVFMLM